MLRNYLLIAFRSLWKNKGIAAINVIGLSLGLACFALLLLHVNDEFSFDRFHAKKDNLFRVYRYSQPMNGEPAEGDCYLPAPLGPAMKTDLTEVVNYVRFCDWGESFVRSPKQLVSMSVIYTDPQVFEMFSFPLRYGDAHTALNELNSVVLTVETALQLFGEENPTGKTLEIKTGDDFEPFTVTGVAENIPPNSSIQFSVLGNYAKHLTSKWGKRSVDNWRRSAYFTYVELKPGSGLATDSVRLQQFRDKYYPDQAAELRNKGYWTGAGAPISYRLQPLPDMHTDITVSGGAPVMNPKYGWILLGLGGLVLLIACINFTTLAIGRSAGRAREIGVRKVIGAYRRQLVGQFLAESLLLSVFSMVLAIGLMYALLPALNDLTDKKLRFDLGLYPELGWMLAGMTVLTGLLAGAYPALVLSGFKPVEALKSKFRVAGSNFFTKSLVTFQFVLSVGLMACTLIMVRQLNFLQTKNPGFNKENVLIVDASDTDGEKIYPLFKSVLAGRPEIAGVASSELALGAESGWSRNGFDHKGQLKEVFEYFIDPDYMQVLGIQLLAGRNFDRTVTADTVTSVIINEAAMRDFGWSLDNVLGQVLTGYDTENPSRNPIVVGVVRDFNFLSLHQEVKPMMFHQFNDYKPHQFFVRMKPGKSAESIAIAEETWTSLVPNLPFRYKFLDENLARFYKAEARWSKIVGYAGALAIILACLGLFGLVALTAVNRTKEIGIRKVLGASVAGITGLLAKDFLKLVIASFVIAFPLASYFMEKWLADFAYRIDIQWWMFAIAGLAAVAIAFLTVSFQSVKAALANPVKSLRSE